LLKEKGLSLNADFLRGTIPPQQRNCVFYPFCAFDDYLLRVSNHRLCIWS